MIQGTIDYIFFGDLDHHADSPNRESKQYEGNELPRPRRSSLSLSALVFLKSATQHIPCTSYKRTKYL